MVSCQCLLAKNNKKPKCQSNAIRGEKLAPAALRKVKAAYLKKATPPKRPKSIPTKKTSLQRALDAVDSAYTAAFPDGIPRENEHHVIDKALQALNEFYPTQTSAVAGSSTPKGKGKDKATGESTPPTTPNPLTPADKKGKRKAHYRDPSEAIQADAYNSDKYNIDPVEMFNMSLPGRLMQAVVYTDAGMDPVCQKLHLRCVSDYDFKWFPLARVVNAMSDNNNTYWITWVVTSAFPDDSGDEDEDAEDWPSQPIAMSSSATPSTSRKRKHESQYGDDSNEKPGFQRSYPETGFLRKPC
ncbi:hypothetical protein C8R44DRAFT_735618 [Mycena epipterygia]|nr:hypothetical protein C8R44DRAFT_735618 [Mycena epipterygia]